MQLGGRFGLDHFTFDAAVGKNSGVSDPAKKRLGPEPR
jgi:hypothetical protein